MRRIFTKLAAALALAMYGTGLVNVRAIADSGKTSPPTPPSLDTLLGPPTDSRPVEVWVDFHLNDINEINDEAETFEFSGVLTSRWRDGRQAFDPATAGVDEKIYQGNYQFNELAPSWFPQLILVNESGLYEKHGVVLRVRQDGSATLVETVNAIARVDMDFRRFPFDTHRLGAVFEVLGFDNSEIVLRTDPETSSSSIDDVRIPQWTVTGTSALTREHSMSYAGRPGVASSYVANIEVQRQSFFISRLVVLPLIIIVLLSFSVFWMERSSLGDRTSVSFIGILTVVAYQIVMSEILPRISYITLMNGFLNLSFFTVCATVVINLIVGALDKRGKHTLGDRIDRRCRWIFPLSYFGLMIVIAVVTFTYF